MTTLSAAFALGVLFGVSAYRLRWLSASGAVAGGAFGASIVALGGWRWAVPAVGFFVFSSLLSKLGRGRAARLAEVSEKGSRRDAGQVLANGGAAWLCLIGHALWPTGPWLWAYLGALGAAAADTWATEIGTLAGGTPRLVTTGRRVPAGTSGAVSAVGLLASGAGAAVVWALGAAVFAAVAEAGAAVVIVGSGVAGALVDSLLGATFQARYRDAHTGAPTERTTTGGQPNTLVRGLRLLNNDRVNLVCTLSGAGLALVLARAAGYL